MKEKNNTSRQKSARALALEILIRCESGGYSNLALDTVIKRNDLTPADRALVTVLTYGVIEKRITLDFIISSLSSIPESKIEGRTRMILRMGIYQLRYMDKIPAFAALNESVELADKRSKGFVNAVLRAYTRRDPDSFLPKREDGVLCYMSVKYSVGESLLSALLSAYGEGECEKLLTAIGNEPSRITLRTNTLRTSREALLAELCESGLDARATEISPDGIAVYGGAAVSDLAPLTDGRATVQDEASQICVRALGACEGDTVLDVCACPGSKSFGAAMTMNDRGRILSFDIHANKLSLVESGASRLGISIIETEAHDAREEISSLVGAADRIICDVPCSGFGVIGKKPELRYKSVEDCAALPRIQLDILENVSKYLRVGGTLVYSTCTVLPEENEKNVEMFLLNHPEFELVPFSVGTLEVSRGYVTLMPHLHGTDGFFVARLTKKY